MLKTKIKHLASIVTLVAIFPIFVFHIIASKFTSSDKSFTGCSQFLSLFPGTTGSYMRVSFFRLTMNKCHKDSYIGFGALFSQQQTELNKGVYIGPQCNIGKCCIEENCLLGSGVHIMSGKGQHKFDDINTPIQEQGGVFENITVGKDSWIGNGALIMANIGKKCIVGAGAVVTSNIPDYSVVAGNPAKIIKSRLN